MTDYLLLVLEDERAHAAQSPTAIAELIARRAAFANELRRAGHLRDCGTLRPTGEGKRVTREGDALRIEAGPFAGSLALAAYYWVRASSLDDAANLGQRIPTLPSDEIDVRPLMKGGVVADKDTKPGKLFAFAVLGSATNEEAWTQVMDRIDADTQNAFPASSALGGNRLQPPSAGRRVTVSRERRAAFDGPFLESKEVIGGVFFLRMMTIDDAVRWATDSRFVVHGTLEIRELWRS
jgi:hypothetical protein